MSGPDPSGARWRPVVHRAVVEVLAHTAGGAVAGALAWYLLGTLTSDRGSFGATVAAWVVIGVMRSMTVQRAMGGGRLDNRAQLRIATGGLVFIGPLALTGTPWMLSVAMAVVTSVHVGWSGYRVWRGAAVQAVIATVAVQIAVHHGWLSTAITVAHSDLVAAMGGMLALALLLNTGVVTRDRDRAEAALAREREQHEAVLRHAATHDRLTDLADRDGMSGRLEDAVAHAAPEAGVAVLFCDLDGFKAVNDTLGHAAGDALLLEVAHRLRSAVRAQDDVARIGGDEFLVLLTDVAGDDVAQTAARLEAELSAPYTLPQGPARIGVSIGAATADSPATPVDALVKSADQAMYAVKAAHHASPTSITARR